MSSGISQRELRGIGTHFDLRKCGFPKVPCPARYGNCIFSWQSARFPEKSGAMIKAFLFDIGNVLVRFDHSRAVEQIQRKSDATAEQIRGVVEAMIAPLETGLLGTEDFLQQAVEGMGFKGTTDEFAEIYCSIFIPHNPMGALVQQLQERYPLYLFSNTSELHLEHLLQNYPVFEAFTDGVFSMRVKSMKPERKIYEAAAELMQVAPHEVFYIDDLPANTQQGAEFGFHAHTYDWREHERLVAEVELLSAEG